MRPENLVYRYYYFKDTCSTRVRDLLNDALDGQLYKEFSQKAAPTNLRKIVQTYTRPLSFVDLILDILMNDRIDAPLNQWDEAFLPVALRRMLLQSANPALKTSTKTSPLVSQSELIIELPLPPTPPLSGHHFYLIAGGLTGFFTLLALSSFKRGLIANSASAIRLLGAAALFYGTTMGILGLILAANWLWLDNPDGSHNANLWFFWPLDLIYIFWGWRWLIRAKQISYARLLDQRMAFHYQDFHLIVASLGVILWYSGLINQNLEATLFFILPPTITMWLCARLIGFSLKADGLKA
jgi:hypothetical protein